MQNASIKTCPDCGGTGEEPSLGARMRCARCDGRGETLISDQQLDGEFPRTEE